MQLSARTDIGKTRNENQDDYRAAVEADGSAWLVVCDGMGGAAGGAVASRLAVETAAAGLAHHSFSDCSGNEAESLLHTIVEQANRAVWERAQEDGSLQGMGTTLVGAIVTKKWCAVIHVGDSRAYLYRDAHLSQLTRDHSMVQEMLEKGMLTVEEAQSHPYKNIITKAIGIQSEIGPESFVCPVQPGDILLLCTDGLTNAVPTAAIEKTLATQPFFDTGDRLIELTLEGDDEDNATAVLLRIEE